MDTHQSYYLAYGGKSMGRVKNPRVGSRAWEERKGDNQGGMK